MTKLTVSLLRDELGIKDELACLLIVRLANENAKLRGASKIDENLAIEAFWASIPEEAEYIARDFGGLWYWYSLPSDRRYLIDNVRSDVVTAKIPQAYQDLPFHVSFVKRPSRC